MPPGARPAEEAWAHLQLPLRWQFAAADRRLGNRAYDSHSRPDLQALRHI